MAKTARKATSKARKKSVARKPTARKAAGSRVMASAFRGGHEHEDDSICACDLDFGEAEITLDAMLPAAKGGVEKVAARARRR